MFSYVDDVLSGRIVACSWVRLACQRHLDDLVTGEERGIYFDEDAAEFAIDFYPLFLRHIKGEWAGDPLQLGAWQEFIIGQLFGWKRIEDDFRRFRNAYISVGRKNGKSTLGSGTGIYLTIADGEPGAEVYTAATKRDQARIIHKVSVDMVKDSPALSERLDLFKDNIYDPRSRSVYVPLGRDSKTMDGLNVHGAIIDELHAHPSGELWDVLATGTGARRQPLMIAITTAGHNRQTICFEFSEYTKKILKGIIQDDTWFGIIYTLDRDENEELESWENEKVWIKANPNLGVSKRIENMRNAAALAKAQPTRLNSFLQKELNIWTQASTRWVPTDHWNRCNQGAIDAQALADDNVRCYGAIDLSSSLDITAFVLVFEAIDKINHILCWFWIPEDNIEDRVEKKRVPYDAWVEQGYIETTPGDVIDYEFILEEIRRAKSIYNIVEIAFDPWRATHVSNKLIEEGAEMVEHRQGEISMNAPMVGLEVAIRQHTINHAGNPVLTWMADNLVARIGATGLVKPDKEKSSEKIDGMVALIMAHGRTSVHGDTTSVYDTRGIRTI